jgi:hypothetical protein
MQLPAHHLSGSPAVQPDQARSTLARVRDHGGLIVGPFAQTDLLGAFEAHALTHCGIGSGKNLNEITRRGAVWRTILPLR